MNKYFCTIHNSIKIQITIDNLNAIIVVLKYYVHIFVIVFYLDLDHAPKCGM